MPLKANNTAFVHYYCHEEIDCLIINTPQYISDIRYNILENHKFYNYNNISKNINKLKNHYIKYTLRDIMLTLPPIETHYVLR